MSIVRRGRLLWLALSTALVLTCCGLGTAAFILGDESTTSQTMSLACGQGGAVDPAGKLPGVSSLGGDQIHNAAIIISVGQQLTVPPRGWVIAIATALQESVLQNLPDLGPRNDHDSIGLFQQRPSQGWGTPEQLHDPVYASRKFYEKLLTINGWQTMALTDAAQAVQKSAYPDAYAKHEPLAAEIVNVLANGAARAVGNVVDARCVAAGEISASGWTVPVRAPIVSGFRPPDRPTHNGVDLAAAKNTPVHAAAAGTVVTVRCEATAANGAALSCDGDGSLEDRGCGWYVDILHADNIITRYCHLAHQPEVLPGQRVAAGQEIGRSGSSGNSSGPHLHFEVHVNGDASSAGAIDPVPFMNRQGAPLGNPA